MKKVSIIIPVYNTEKYLRRCLDSVFEQTYQEFEVICINDKSPDKCGGILSEYKIRYPEKLKIIENEKNMRSGPSKDKALLITTGDYITYLDSDDYIAKDYLKRYVDAFKKHEVDIVVGGYTKDIDGKMVEHHVTNTIWSLTTYVIACSKMYKKEFLIKNDMKFGTNNCLEDMLFNLTGFFGKPKYFVMEDYVGYYYYFNRKSVTSTYDFSKNQEEQTIKAFNTLFEKCDIKALDKDDYWILQYTYIANIVNSLITYNRKSGIKVMRKKYNLCMRDLEKKFPDYKKNPYIGIFKPKGQLLKIRLGVGVAIRLRKMHMDKLLYYLVALV